jgi:hypothetical protein
MVELIARCLAWVGVLLIPRPGGRHRATQGAHETRTGRRITVRAWEPPRLPAGRHRRSVEQWIDGDATALVRPYLVAEEQRQRRHALLLATMGLDEPGPCWIHGVEVAA